MFQNPSNEQIKELLQNAKTIAVVGISDNPSRPSNQVSEYIQAQGYEIIPVNPKLSSILGRKAYASLEEIKEPVDIVDVFRRSEGIPEVVDHVLSMKHKPKAVWIQLGIVNDEQCRRIEDAGIMAIQDACIKIEHYKLLT
jgi:predicted CoA-binding protein